MSSFASFLTTTKTHGNTGTYLTEKSVSRLKAILALISKGDEATDDDRRAAMCLGKQLVISLGEGVAQPEGWTRGGDSNAVCYKQAPGATDEERVAALLEKAQTILSPNTK